MPFFEEMGEAVASALQARQRAGVGLSKAELSAMADVVSCLEAAARM